MCLGISLIPSCPLQFPFKHLRAPEVIENVLYYEPLFESGEMELFFLLVNNFKVLWVNFQFFKISLKFKGSDCLIKIFV